MQVKNYCKKNQIPAQDVIELLASQYGGAWLLTSQLNAQIIDFLNQTFGNFSDSKQLPASKEQLQLPESKNNSELASDLTVQNNSEQSSNLTITDVQELQTEIQISEVQETAIHDAVQAFQTYTDTYDEITRALILKDVHQRTALRNQRRIEFENKQNTRKSELVEKQQNSTDSKTEMLQVLKSDNYKNEFLTNILGGL